MDSKEIQKKIDVIFKENFAYTPLNERLKDLQNEFFELMRWQDINNLKEETGDLLASLIMLCNENGWDFNDLISNTLQKIENRSEQYKTLGRKTKIAILGLAANPIHNGHIQLAQFVLNTSGEFDEVWLMPSNNHMLKDDIIDSKHRLKMCELAVEKHPRIKVFDYEIKNKLKGETYYFFKRLKEEKELTEKYQFTMIIGLDNANTFDKWVNYKELENLAQFVVVPRKGVERDMSVDWYLQKPHIFLNSETDIINISSTEIRSTLHNYDMLPPEIKAIKKVKILKMIDENVFNYIIKNKLY